MSWWRRGLLARADSHRGQGVLLTWWGSFPNGGATLGDYHAVANVARALRQHGIEHSVLNCAPIAFPDTPTVDGFARDEGNYAVLVFVCGPLALTRSMRRLLRRFKSLRKVAIGVSLLDGNPVNSLFDRIVARDSTTSTTFDLALAYADLAAPTSPQQGGHFAVCLRGPQKTYGRANCLSELAESVLKDVARSSGLPASSIDTVIRPGNDTANIESGFTAASLVATTRMHGALFALAHRVPFLAIDQIRGGAKVWRMMSEVGWKAAFRADRLDGGAVARAATEMIHSGWTSEMEQCRTKAIGLSKAALDLGRDAIVNALVQPSGGYRTER